MSFAELLLPALTAILAAIPTVYTAIWAQNKKNRAEAKKERQDYSRELTSIIEALRERLKLSEAKIDTLQSEHETCLLRMRQLLDALAKKGILSDFDHI